MTFADLWKTSPDFRFKTRLFLAIAGLAVIVFGLSFDLRDRVTRLIPCGTYTFLHCVADKNGKTDRHRFDSGAFRTASGDILTKKELPFIVEPIILLRDRLKDLSANNQNMARWALNRQLFFNFTVFLLITFVVIFRLRASKPGETAEGAQADQAVQNEPAPDAAQETKPHWTGMFSHFWKNNAQYTPIITLLVGAILAVAQSFAYHSQYKAAFTAYRAYDTLTLRIETQASTQIAKYPTAWTDEKASALSALQAKSSATPSDKAEIKSLQAAQAAAATWRSEFAGLIVQWNDAFKTSREAFDATYSDAYALISYKL